MKISVRKAAPDVYSLAFDSQEIVLDGADVKLLLMEITRMLAPGTSASGSPSARAEDLIRNLRRANDVGVQALIRQADHEDILILLKAAESDPATMERLNRNMSERLRKICAEDLAYKFKEPPPIEQRLRALARLSGVARSLEDSGILVYRDVKTRPQRPRPASGTKGS